jgi:O-antigen ligase
MPSLVFLGLTLPWLNPVTWGPMSGALPLWFSWVCAAVALGVIAAAPARWSAGQLMRVAAGAWLAAALVSVFIGLLQYVGAAEWLSGWVSPTPLGVAFANLRQRNQFASLTSLGLVALLWWVTCQASSKLNELKLNGSSPPLTPLPLGDAFRPQAGLHLAGTLGAAILLGVGNAASSSRTGLMQLVLIAGLAVVWGGLRQPAVRRTLLVTGLAYGLASVALPWLAGLDPLSNGAWARLRDGDSVCASRLTLWGNVLHLIAQKPWLGWGWGELDYAHFITLYPGKRFCDILDNAHNLPLHLAVELGVPAAVLLCGAVLVAVWRAKPWVDTDPLRQLAWAGVAVIGLHSLLEYPLWYGPFQVALGLCGWFLWRTRASANTGGVKAGTHTDLHSAPQTALNPNLKPFRPLAGVFIVLIASLLIASGAYATWDYYRISQVYLSPAKRLAAYRENTLAKIQGSVLFKQQVRFAELTTTTLTPTNAAHIHRLALALLHFSPEPRVINKLIDSAELLGRPDEAQFYQVRLEAAFARQ